MKKKKPILFFLGIILLLSLFGCSQQQEVEQETQRDYVTVGVEADAIGFAPYQDLDGSTFSINSNMFESLVTMDHSYRMVPLLAERWDNPNPTTWRLYLRKGVTFHNGYDFTARDVKYTYEFIQNGGNDDFIELLSDIVEINIIDDHTLDLVTKDPHPVLLNSIMDVSIVSEKYQKETTVKDKPIGTGPYKLKRYVPGDAIEFERYENYWDTKPAAKTATMKIIEDDDKRVDAILNGEVDIVEFVPPNQVTKLKTSKSVDHLEIPTIRVIYLGFDFREEDSYAFSGKKNPTSDVLVRRAMYHGINEDKILADVMEGQGVPATQFIPSTIFGYDPSIERLPYDVDKAKELLSQAGYPDGFAIIMDCPNNRYINDEEICHEIASQLALIGIDVTVDARPKAEFFPKVAAHNSSFFLAGWSATPGEGGDIFDFILLSITEERNVGWNAGFYSNPEIDRLGDLIQKEMNPKTRKELLQEGFRVAMDDVVWIPLHLQSLNYGKAKDIDWRPRMDGRFAVKDINFK